MLNKELLQNKGLRFFLFTRLFLTFGLQMQAVIIGWEIFRLTSDPFSLGLVGLAEAIPAISIALYAGHLADIRSKKRIMLGSLLVILLSSLGMWFGFHFLNHNSWQLIIIYSCIALSGFARGFYAPASFSSIALLVPREWLARASTLNSTAWQFAAVIGPALGGFSYAYLGLPGSFAIIIGFLLGGFIFLSQVPIRFEPNTGKQEALMHRLKEGIHYVYTNKVMLSAFSLDLFSVLFGGATALLPVFANEILNTGPEGLGLLRAAPSLGAVMMMSYLSLRKPIEKAGIVLIQAVAAFGVCMLLFGISENFYFSMALLFLSGAFDSISVVIRSNILQLQTPDSMRGRVSAVNTIFIGSSNEIGAFESGLAARLLGTANSVIFGGSMTLIIVGITHLKAHSLRKLKFEKLN